MHKVNPSASFDDPKQRPWSQRSWSGTAPSAAPAMVLGPNPKRIRLTFNAPAVNRVAYGFGPQVTLDNAYLVMFAGNPPVSYSRADVGEAICDWVWAIAAVADQTVSGSESTDCGG